MAKKCKKAKECPPEGAPAWMTTYGDLMTLLLCFFVMLFSLSEIKKEKFIAVASAIRGFFNFQGSMESVFEDTMRKDSFQQDFREFLKRVNEERREPGQGVTGYDGKHIRVRKIREGLQITLGDKQLFDEGSARLRLDDPAIREGLDYLAKQLVGYRFVVRVNGFASPTEVGKIKDPAIKDLWDLSIARARSVMKYLTEGTRQDLRVRKERIRLGANGPYNLVKGPGGNEIPAENRSVEIIVTEQRVFFEGEDEPLQ